jgi:uncharacterized protein (DUF983 family)
MALTPDLDLIKLALKCKCPRCKEGDLYPSRFSFELNDKCNNCDLDIKENDNGDGPAVFLIFILGFTITPLAILVEFTLFPPYWFHAVFWSIITLSIILISMKPLKAYIMGLQFKHRPGTWDKNNNNESKTK